MDYLELLLAAKVRELASALKTRQSGNYYSSLTDDDNAVKREKMGAWDAAHPTIDFVPMALKQLQEVAVIIKQQLP